MIAFIYEYYYNMFTYISVCGRMEDYNFIYEFLKTKTKIMDLYLFFWFSFKDRIILTLNNI